MTRSVRIVECAGGGMWLGCWTLQLDGLQREKRRASFVFTGKEGMPVRKKDSRAALVHVW